MMGMMSVMGMMGVMGKMDMMGQTTRQLCYQQCTAGALWRKAAESFSHHTRQDCHLVGAAVHMCMRVGVFVCSGSLSTSTHGVRAKLHSDFEDMQERQGSRYGGSDNTTTLLSTVHRGGALEESSRKFVVITPGICAHTRAYACAWVRVPVHVCVCALHWRARRTRPPPPPTTHAYTHT